MDKKKFCDVVFVPISSYSPLSDRADNLGMVKEWRADYNNISFAWGDTKKECMAEARRLLPNI